MMEAARDTALSAPPRRRARPKFWPLCFGAASLLLELLLTTGPVERLTEHNQIVHDTQHGLIFAGALVMGIALRQALRGRTRRIGGRRRSARVSLGVAALALAGEILLITPWSDHLADAHRPVHYAVHGLMFVAGAIAGSAIDSARLHPESERNRSRAASA